MSDTKGLYPSIENDTGNANSFRLNEISRIKTFFHKEIEDRRKVCNKYRKYCAILNWTNSTGGIISILGGAGTIGLIFGGSILLEPVAIVIEATCVAIGLGTFGLGILNKSLIKKLEKHDELFLLAVTKLNTINDLISKALIDSHIDDFEFKLIIAEHEKYIQLKNQIRHNFLNEQSEIKKDDLRKTLEDELKKKLEQDFLEKWKILGKQEVSKLISSSQ